MRNHREIITYAFVASASLAMLMIGLVSLVGAFIFPSPAGLDSLIAPDAAIGGALSGVAFLVAAQQVRWLQYLSGATLALIGTLVLCHHSGIITLPYARFGLTSTVPAAAVFFLLIGLNFLIIKAGSLINALRRLSALLLVLTGATLALMNWTTGFNVSQSVNPSATTMLGFYTIFSGGNLWFMTHQALRPQPLLQTISSRALAGVTLATLLIASLWYINGVQHFRSVSAQADQVVNGFASSLRNNVSQHRLLLQRLAQRFSTASDAVSLQMVKAEASGYLWDLPGVQALGLLNSSAELTWNSHRGVNSTALPTLLRNPDIKTWLDKRTFAPRSQLLHRISGLRGMALLSLPVLNPDNSPGQLLGLVDMETLLRDQLQKSLAPFGLRVSIDGQNFLALSPPDSDPDNAAPLFSPERLNVSNPPLSVQVLHMDQRALALTPNLLLGITMLGFFLSFFTLVTVEQAAQSQSNANALQSTLERITRSRRIQELISRNSKLTRTLDAINHLVEDSIPDCVAGMLIQPSGHDRMYLAVGNRLPANCRQSVTNAAQNGAFPACNQAIRSGRAESMGFHTSEPLHLPFIRSGFQRCRAYPLLDPDAQVVGCLLVFSSTADHMTHEQQDVIEEALNLGALALERHRILQDLQRNQQRYGSLFHENPDIVLSLSPDGLIADANIAATHEFEHPDSPLSGQAFCQLFDPHLRDIIHHHITSARHGAAQRFDASRTVHDRDPTHFDITALPILVDGQADGVFCIAKDISDQIQHKAELAHHANHDALTGLPNRVLLEDRLNQSCQQAQRQGSMVVVLFIDLDGFKPINDSLGHAIGDQVLVEVAERLHINLRVGDTLARFGGDEFVVVLNDLRDAVESIPVIERLLATTATPYQVDGMELTLTASIGASVSGATGSQDMELVQEADMAMYKAKSHGRNQFQWYTDDINQRLSDRVQMRNKLQDAIDNEHFEMYYQPIAGRDGITFAFESLIRWPHAQHGFISPAEFIPLAEDTGQILAIGDWVMRTTLRDIQSLRQIGNYRLGVNLSPLQFHQPEFRTWLHECLARACVEPDVLTLEITEGVLMDNTERAIRLLGDLRDDGVRIAIDDFGTGFSSLSYLRDLPIGTIKIDRSFIREILTNPDNQAITHSVIDLAHRLNLRVAAEGIETPEQYERVHRLGCDLFQGYHIAHPMPLAALRDYLKA